MRNAFRLLLSFPEDSARGAVKHASSVFEVRYDPSPLEKYPNRNDKLYNTQLIFISEPRVHSISYKNSFATVSPRSHFAQMHYDARAAKTLAL